MNWLEDRVRTYLERDVPQMGFRIPAIRLRRLWTMLAHLQGEPANSSKLGGNLEIDRKTVNHYIDVLVGAPARQTTGAVVCECQQKIG